MKDLIRQNKSQKQSESSVNGNNANGGISTGNSVNHSVNGKEGSSNKPTSKKIKIDNAKIKNMQMQINEQRKSKLEQHSLSGDPSIEKRNNLSSSNKR